MSDVRNVFLEKKIEALFSTKKIWSFPFLFLNNYQEEKIHLPTYS
jgi:hypothetical protein